MLNHPGSLSKRPGVNARAIRSDTLDVLAEVVQTLGLRTRIFCRSSLGAPWTLAMSRGAFAHFHAIQKGDAFLLLTGRAPLALKAGDLIILMRGQSHWLASSAKRTAPALRVSATDDARCAVLANSKEGPRTQMLCGAFSFIHREAHPLGALLPEIIHIPSATAAPLKASMRLLWQEVREQRPGSRAIATRLTDCIFIQALRVLLEQGDSALPGWLGALRDMHIGRALAQLHADPARAWTVAELAGRVGMSRSPFAARFKRLVGMPPLGYLAGLRLQKAAAMLLESRLALSEVASAAGYQSESAFSKVFRRTFGSPPGAYRRALGGNGSHDVTQVADS